MTEAHKGDCSRCLELILWQWGHRTDNIVQAIQEKVALTRSQTSTLPLNAEVIQLLDDIQDLAQQLVDVPSPFSTEQVELNALVKGRIGILKREKPYSNVEFRLELDSTESVLFANRVWLRRLFDILIDNAVYAVEECADKQIVISTTRDEKGAEIAVRDNGQGIDISAQTPDELWALESGGRGRALHIAQLIAGIYGGKSEIQRTGDSGNVQTVWLPRGDC